MENARFRNKVIVGILLLTAVIMYFPTFFSVIERRDGVVLNDWILNHISSFDFSVPIFIIIWSLSALFLIRSFTQPALFIRVIYCLLLICIVRIITISLVPLNPPENLIKITDPLTSLTYGGKDVFITKDLFFSGHTSNVLMLALCFEKKTDKVLAFLGALAVGAMVLFQHVHYSIDVIAAFVFTFILVWAGKRLSAH